jgi:hypothetical protein
MLYDDLVPKGQWLCHHGIKGQKWGVRRYQNKDGSLTELGRKRYLKSRYGMSNFSGIYRGGLNNFISEQHYTYTDERGVNHFKDVIDLKDDRINNDYIDDPSTAFSKHYTKVNPMYGKQTGTVNNCTKCAAAMIMAKKGYDFEAGRSWDGGSGAFDYWFDGGERNTYDDAFSAISGVVKTKSGSYGTIDFRNKMNPKAGHVINWEHNNDGTFSLFDSQNGTSFTSDTFSDVLSQYNDSLGNMFDMNNTIHVSDLTSAKPNWGHLSEDAVLRFDSQDYSKNQLYDWEYRKFYTDL